MKTHYLVLPPLEQSCVVLFIGSPGKPRFKFAVCLSIVNKDRDFLGGPMAKTVFPMLGAQVPSLARELDPTYSN